MKMIDKLTHSTTATKLTRAEKSCLYANVIVSHYAVGDFVKYLYRKDNRVKSLFKNASCFIRANHYTLPENDKYYHFDKDINLDNLLENYDEYLNEVVKIAKTPWIKKYE